MTDPKKKQLSLRMAENAPDQKTTGKRSFDRYLTFGLVGLLALVGGGGGWALTTEIAGAVIAAGSIVEKAIPRHSSIWTAELSKKSWLKTGIW